MSSKVSEHGLTSYLKQNPWFIALLALVVSLVGVTVGVASIYFRMEDRLNNLDTRLSNIEGQLNVLKDVALQNRVITVTTTSIYSGVALPIGGVGVEWLLIPMIFIIALWVILRQFVKSINQTAR